MQQYVQKEILHSKILGSYSIIAKEFNDAAAAIKKFTITHTHEDSSKHIVKFWGDITKVAQIQNALPRNATDEDFIQALIKAKTPRLEDGRLNKEGKRHGLYQTWYENGQQKEKSKYKNGQRHGLYETWGVSGARNNLSLWKQGGVIKSFETDEEFMAQTELKSGRFDITFG